MIEIIKEKEKQGLVHIMHKLEGQRYPLEKMMYVCSKRKSANHVQEKNNTLMIDNCQIGNLKREENKMDCSYSMILTGPRYSMNWRIRPIILTVGRQVACDRQGSVPRRYRT